MEQRLITGDIVKHFKREEYLKKYDHLEDWLKKNAYFNDLTYMYEILLTDATHTETKERLVVYRALYNNEDMGVEFHQIFARPYDMFMSEVDHEKYPNVKQKYRFESVNKNDCSYGNWFRQRY